MVKLQKKSPFDYSYSLQVKYLIRCGRIFQTIDFDLQNVERLVKRSSNRFKQNNRLNILSDHNFFSTSSTVKANKVNIRDVFFFPGFAHEFLLILSPFVLNAELNFLPDGIIFKEGHRAKISPPYQIINSHNGKSFEKTEYLL